MNLWNFHSHISNTYSILNIDLTEENKLPPPTSFYTLGLHPWFINDKQIINSFKTALNKHQKTNNLNKNKLIGIGECGLDRLKGPELSLQIQVLEQIFKLAQKNNLPIILHCVRSYPELIKIIKLNHQQINIAVHGFSGGINEAKTLIKYGVKLSFGKSLLFSLKLQNCLKFLSINDFFIETDNSFIDINKIYHLVSKIKQIQTPILAKQIQKNIFNFFALS